MTDERPFADAPPPSSPAGLAVLSRLTGFLPNFFYYYEYLCRFIASDGVHNLGFFMSTYFCGPAGLYIWESRTGGGWLRRLILGLLAWIVLAFGLLLFIKGFGWLIGIPPLLLGRPFRFIIRRTKLARPRPSLQVPQELTFKLGYMDVAALAFIAFIFLVLVANRDDLLQLKPIMDSDPAYHMAVARQVSELGRVPRWDRWEYAPFGRPHLYPPVLHILVAFFAGSPEEILFGFNTIQMLFLPLALLGGWYFARWLYGPAFGFATLILLSMDTAYLISQGMVLPAAMATALMPLMEGMRMGPGGSPACR